MHDTPFFPAWNARLAPMRRCLANALRPLRACTLCQLEQRFSSLLPASLFIKAKDGPNSRDSLYTQCRTFWCFLWQCLNVGTPGREVVRQLQALLELAGVAPISSKDGAYCTARQRLPESLFVRALRATAVACEHLAPPVVFLKGRPVKLVDGTIVTLPDTPANQEAYPQVRSMKKWGSPDSVDSRCFTGHTVVGIRGGVIWNHDLSNPWYFRVSRRRSYRPGAFRVLDLDACPRDHQ